MIPNPYILLAVVLAWAASLVGVGWWQRHDGAAATVAAYEKRDNEALVAANAAIDQLNREARATEKAHTEQLATIGDHYATEFQVLEARRRRDVDAARDGAIRLRVAGACPPGGGGAAEAPAAAAGRDGAQDAELPRAVTADLLALADDADAVVAQLTACQAVIVSDRNPKGATP